MKIADISSYTARVGGVNLCFLRVESDDGYYGWGEAGVGTRSLAVDGAVRHFCEFLLGKDPMRRGALWQHMYRGQYYEGGRILTSAISAIDIALHDLVARKLGVPVYELLGGKHRDYIPCFITMINRPGPEMIDEVLGRIDEGWSVFRSAWVDRPSGGDPSLFEPRESLAETAKWLTRLREAVGGDPVLGIDYHHRLSVAEAASFCQRMPPGTLDFLEEPIRDETPAAYAELRRLTDIPFAIGEEFASKWQALPYIEEGLTNFARMDILNIGGFTEFMKVAGWCEAHYIDLMPHNPSGPVGTAAHLHLGAAVPNFAWLEDRSTERQWPELDEIVLEQPRLEGVWYPVPDGPGLGIEIDVDAIKDQPFEFWSSMHLHRRDGSYTNF